MSCKNIVFGLFGVALAITLAEPAEARVKRFVVEDRSPFIEGMSWGKAGAYERLRGTAYLEVDPADPLNAVIVNLDKAPRNKRGMVEFSAPFLIVKPVNMKRGNRKIWFGVNNRGMCLEIGVRSFPVGRQDTCNYEKVEEVGEDNPLFKEGFTFVDAGWQGDGITPSDGSRIYPDFPVATKSNGKPIVGSHRIEVQPTVAAFTQPLFAYWKPYPAADTDTKSATLTVRDQIEAKREKIPDDEWAFGTCPDGQQSLTPTATDLCLFDGFKPRKIYELIYQAKNPIVMGLAYAVTRDIGSFLRFQKRDDAGNPNPLTTDSVEIRRAYISGTSATGRYVREFLYLGFNEDERHRKVYDAATVYGVGSHRLFANVQFAQPVYLTGQAERQDYLPTALPPFTYAVTADPATGLKDGILKRPATDPLVIQIDEELMFWQTRAALNVVNADGDAVSVPRGVRLYFQNGFGHIGAVGLLALPRVAATCQHPTHSASVTTTLRAMVKVIDDWADHGIEPPPSNYPTVQRNQLVSLKQYRDRFPEIPGLVPPTRLNKLQVLYFGPNFGPTGGVLTIVPPMHGPSYKVLLPKPTKDGDGAGGVDTMLTRVPLGTNVGWNLQTVPRESDLCGLAGSFVPFATTADERVASGDSRASLEERYGDHQGFVKAVKRAARQLVSERFMIEEDAGKYIKAAKESDVLKSVETAEKQNN